MDKKQKNTVSLKNRFFYFVLIFSLFQAQRHHLNTT